MKVPGLRHSAEQVGGIVFFGRMLDKIRLHAQGKLPADYNVGPGFDGRVCRFLHVEYPAVVQRTLAGGTDDEILAWCFAHGRKPNEEEIRVRREERLERRKHSRAGGDEAKARVWEPRGHSDIF
jgi:hypothetical protein